MSTPDRPEDMWTAPTPIDLDRDNREIRRALTPMGASMATFVIAAFTVPLNAHIVDEVVLAVIIGLIVVAGRLGGLGPALYGALMGGLSFDFFHVEPVRVLHARTLLICVAVFGLAALLASTRPRPASHRT